MSCLCCFVLRNDRDIGKTVCTYEQLGERIGAFMIPRQFQGARIYVDSGQDELDGQCT